MVTKMAYKIGLKQRNCHIGPNFRLFDTDFFLKMDISTVKYQKKFNMLCVVVIRIFC